MSEATTTSKPQASKFDFAAFIIRAANVGGLAIIILLLSTIIASLAPGFLSPFNLFALTRNLAIDTVIGFAMMVVLACGHFNLAVGSIGVSAIMATGFLLEGLGFPIPVSIAGGLATGALMGWLNGMLVVKTGIHSFVITLATASLYFGLMLILTKAEAFRNLPAAFNVLGKQRFLGPYSSMLFVTGFVAAALLILFKYSVIGRQILASGANPLAAEMSGASGKASNRRGPYIIGFAREYCRGHGHGAPCRRTALGRCGLVITLVPGAAVRRHTPYRRVCIGHRHPAGCDPGNDPAKWPRPA